MRAVFACLAVWLLAVSPASGQFTILSDERSVEAHNQWTSYILFYGPINATYDERVVAAFMEPLSVTLRAVAVATPEVPPDLPPDFPLPPFYGPASATAWHDSRVSANEIFLSGGTDRVSSGSMDAWSSAQSNARVEFALAVPVTVEIIYERIDAGNTGTLVPQTHSGDASIFITGPGLNVSLPALTLADWIACDADPACRGTLRPAEPVIGHEFLTLAAGTYVIDAAAVARSTGPASQETPNPSPASFMVRISATPIPEPHTLILLAVGAILFLFWRRYRS